MRGLGKRPLHPFDRPEQIDGGRTRRRHQIAELLEFSGELLGPRRLAAPHPERQAHRGGHANRRRATNHHRFDRFGDVVRRAAGHVHLDRRQLALVDHHDRVVFPFDCRQHATAMISGDVSFTLPCARFSVRVQVRMVHPTGCCLQLRAHSELRTGTEPNMNTNREVRTWKHERSVYFRSRSSNGSGRRSLSAWRPVSRRRFARITSRSPPNSHRI